MCFSATASFGAGIVLSGIGAATLQKTHHRSQRMFAAIPFIFSIQQFAEGLLWLSMTQPSYEELRTPATYFFLFIAQVIWPIWVPSSILKLENPKSASGTQKMLVIVGAMVSVYLLTCLLIFNVEANITGNHIAYTQNYPSSIIPVSGILYIIATIAPSFFSAHPRMKLLGIAVSVSYIVTAIFYQHYIISVWCFFAAIVSISIYAILFYRKRDHTQSLMAMNI